MPVIGREHERGVAVAVAQVHRGALVDQRQQLRGVPAPGGVEQRVGEGDDGLILCW